VFESLEDSRSVSEDVECKLRSVNIRRVSDPWRAFRPAFRATGISDDKYRRNWDLHDGYRSTMGVIGISLGVCRSARLNFGCTWECHGTNVGITNKFWEMPGFLWIFIWRTAGVIWDSSDIHEQSTSLSSKYAAWMIVHYDFWIITSRHLLPHCILCHAILRKRKK